MILLTDDDTLMLLTDDDSLKVPKKVQRKAPRKAPRKVPREVPTEDSRIQTINITKFKDPWALGK